MPRAEARILFEDRQIRVVHQAAASDFSLVTFSDFTYRPQGSEFWGRETAEKLGIDAVGFIAKRENWFPVASVEAAAPAVRAVLKPRSVTYGYSMGGYGALKHAARLGAQGCLAVAPQVTIAPGATPWDARFHRFHRPALHAGMAVSAEDLAPFVAVLADPHDPVDWRHAELLAALGPVHLMRMPMLGHAAIWMLAGSAPLGAALGHVFAGDAAALRAELRARRRQSGHWYRLMGRAAFRRGHDRLAERLWDRGREAGMPEATIGAERADALGDRIAALIRSGRRKDAVAACARLEGLDPQAPGPVARAAHLRLAAGAAEEAEAAFRRALALKPDGADLHLGLSLSLSTQGRAAEALEAARAGLATAPDDVELATHLGHLLNAGTPAEREEAEGVFRAALARHPASGRALLGLSSVLARQGKREKALSLAHRAASRLPGDLDALAWLARLLLANGKADRAERLFRRVLRRAPRRPEGYLGLAEAMRATGRRAEALAMIDSGLARLPDEPSLTALRTAMTGRPSWPRRMLRRLHRVFGLAWS